MKWWMPFAVAALASGPLGVWLLLTRDWHFAVAGVFAGVACGIVAWPFAMRIISRPSKEDA